MNQQLFVLVASQQAVASLPPVLELANPGDQAVWLESPQARENRWSEGAGQVLQRHGLRLLPPVGIAKINDPFSIAHACKPIVRLCREQGMRPVIVANGGTKLTLFGPHSAFYELEPTIVYGADRPAELWIFPRAFRQAPEVQAYLKHTLDLEDILVASGHLATRGQRIWPSDETPAINRAVINRGYQFEKETAYRVVQVLRQHQGYGVVRSAWMNVAITKASSLQGLVQASSSKKKKRAKSKAGGFDLTDWDIVLVLRNGLLIYLECKSGARSTRDLLGRMAILQRASSQLAQMYTCIPFDMTRPDETARYRSIRTSFDRVGLKLLPVPQSGLEGVSDIPSFESELEKILLAYKPVVISS